MVNTLGHVHAGEKAGSTHCCRLWRHKHEEGEASLFGAERDVDKKQRSDDCACMCTRVELHVTGSRHEGKGKLSPTL